MQRRTLMVCAVALGCLTATMAAEFRLYPGAKSDDWTAKAMIQAKAALIARETVLGGPGLTLPNGTTVTWSFFVLDSGKTLADSKLWLKVQRPSVVDNEMKDVRDITSIQLVRKK